MSFEVKTPLLAVDAVILLPGVTFLASPRLVTIQRKYPPLGMALPGGFVDVGESVEQAVVREVKEETGLDVTIERLIGVYSNPNRDPRRHVVSCAFLVFPMLHNAEAKAGDDAKEIQIVEWDLTKKEDWCFDHFTIVQDVLGHQYDVGQR